MNSKNVWTVYLYIGSVDIGTEHLDYGSGSSLAGFLLNFNYAI